VVVEFQPRGEREFFRARARLEAVGGQAIQPRI
jgi:hypothetical protein